MQPPLCSACPLGPGFSPQHPGTRARAPLATSVSPRRWVLTAHPAFARLLSWANLDAQGGLDFPSVVRLHPSAGAGNSGPKSRLKRDQVNAGRCSIQISVETHEGEVVLRVADSSPGIPSTEKERILDRFYPVAGQSKPGSGLGLSIVQRICELYGARIRLIDGELGRGLVVEVTFREAMTRLF